MITRTAINAEISVFVICVDAIIYFILYNLDDCTFNLERNYVDLKSKSARFLLSKKINFNKNETDSKMENPTHAFIEMNLMLHRRQFI